jgi:hypothetical protein
MSTIRTVTTLKLDRTAVEQVRSGPTGPVWNAVSKAAAQTRDRAKVDLISKSLVDKGRLAQSIESIVELRGQEVVGRIGTDVTYAPFVHEGTDSPIVPRVKRALAFKPKGGARMIVVGQVRGTKETGRYSPFLTNALDQLNIRDFT